MGFVRVPNCLALPGEDSNKWDYYKSNEHSCSFSPPRVIQSGKGGRGRSAHKSSMFSNKAIDPQFLTLMSSNGHHSNNRREISLWDVRERERAALATLNKFMHDAPLPPLPHRLVAGERGSAELDIADSTLYTL